MNERPDPQKIREGFVDPAKQEKQAPQPVQVTVQPPAAPSMPPPELEPPLEEQSIQIIPDKWPVVVKLLYKPLVIPGDKTYTELSFREPRGGDINRYGNPIRVNQDGDVIIDERKMTYMIAALSNVLPQFIEEMDPRDWNSCAYRLRRFFLPDPAAW